MWKSPRLPHLLAVWLVLSSSLTLPVCKVEILMVTTCWVALGTNKKTQEVFSTSTWELKLGWSPSWPDSSLSV